MSHHITAASSNDTPSGDAFAFTAVSADSLIVDAGAFLISRSAGSGANLDGSNGSSWTIAINGAVEALGAASDGLDVFGLVSNASKVTVGRSGDIFGIASGVASNLALSLVNFGTISGGNSISAVGPTHITNAGVLVGDVRCYSGNDSFTDFKKVGGVIKSGTVVGLVDLGDGDDHFNGGAHAETFRDSPGTENCKLGGGNDTYLAVLVPSNPDGADIISGGSGVDTYDASGASTFLNINLDKVSHGFLLGAHSASGAKVGSDHITGFENVIGGSAGDTIFGSSARNTINGGAGDDHLFGLGGRDVLTGGTEADTFRFLKLTDSGTLASTRDLITDFSGTGADGDKIDLSDITVGGNPAFNSFIGTAQFGHNPGELRESFSGGNTIVSGDVNGDGKADFSIELKDHLILQATDFVLL
jgi:Ca2+-binding RTX toxin-like protein